MDGSVKSGASIATGPGVFTRTGVSILGPESNDAAGVAGTATFDHVSPTLSTGGVGGVHVAVVVARTGVGDPDGCWDWAVGAAPTVCAGVSDAPSPQAEINKTIAATRETAEYFRLLSRKTVLNNPS